MLAMPFVKLCHESQFCQFYKGQSSKTAKQLVASQTTGVVFSEGKEELPENTVGLSVA